MRAPLIRDLYAAFNARDIEAVIAHLDPDVDWPNAWEGGRLHGHEAVREYWTRQFAAIDGRVEPQEVVADGERVVVTVHQTVRDLDGQLQDDRVVTHTYTIRDDKIVRMDVTEPEERTGG
jgi:ketosteroid isomerase-like protein